MLRNHRGFSLVEIMIVLAIIGIIVGLASGGISYFEKAKVKEANVKIKQLGDALEMYYTDCSIYPTTDQGLAALVEAPSDCEEWGPEPYIKKIPKDPWKREYIYESDGSDFEIKSLGKDRKEGGEGLDADISSKED